MIGIIQEGNERADKVVGFCSQEYVVTGKRGLGGRRRVAGLQHKGIAERVSSSLTVGLERRKWVCERVHCDINRASYVNSR